MDVPSRKVKIMLTHQEFFAACEALKKNKQRFLDERPDRDKAAQILSEMIEKSPPMAGSSVAKMQEATGVRWTSRKTGKSGFSGYSAIMSLVTAVNKLYDEHPELSRPTGLVNLTEYQQDRKKS